jgi:hypothetical protein
MKKIKYLFFIVISLGSCTDESQDLIKKISGTWKVNEIVYSKTGNTKPDSIVNYQNGIFQLDNCTLTGSSRQCAGYYLLNGKETKFNYGVDANSNTTFIQILDLKTSINLRGDYRIEQTGNNLTLSGPEGKISSYVGGTITIKLSK